MAQKKGKILIIDDNDGILKSLNFILKHEFEEIETIKNPNRIPNLVQSKIWDVIMLDMNFSAGLNSGNEGIFWMNEILKIDPDAIIILMTAYGDIDLAVKTIKQGATDFIQKPWNTEKLLATLHAAYQLRQSKLKVNTLIEKQKFLNNEIDKNFNNIIGESEPMQKVFDTIKKIAKTDANVMILGENGTGKELIAREIHKQSHRANDVFICVDLGAIPETLFESELFGHTKGAFTDAKEERKGRFEIASGGTLFLDEIGNLPLSLQSKLLTVLQNRYIIPIGSNKPVPIDIRLISATNKSIQEMIKEGLFREDLLYRINTIRIDLPPLRERNQDIEILANHFLQIHSQKYNKKDKKFSQQAIEQLMKYKWPGNVRELNHTIEKAILLSDSNTISPSDFHFQENTQAEEKTNFSSLNLEEIEKKAVKEALFKHKGNINKAANELGITRKTLYTKIEKYGF